jgi:ubiquinone/menaquinone biosynthesis C-methylase UbiE
MQYFKDKNGILKNIDKEDKIVIELGGGKNKKGRINIDQLDLPEVDIVTNLEEGLSFLPDNSVDEIHSKSLLEHINNLNLLMKEIHRVLKKNGSFHCFVPHFSNPYFYSDPTHVRFFGYYTFYYYADEESMEKIKRKVPSFYNEKKFTILSQKLTFSSPFKIYNKLLKIVEKIINRNIFLQEFYEGILINFIKCYGISSVLKPRK